MVEIVVVEDMEVEIVVIAGVVVEGKLVVPVEIFHINIKLQQCIQKLFMSNDFQKACVPSSLILHATWEYIIPGSYRLLILSGQVDWLST